MLEINASDFTEVSTGLIHQVGRIGLWLQALGIIVILWIIFQVVTLIINRKRNKEIYLLKDNIARIEKKIDSLAAKIK